MMDSTSDDRVKNNTVRHKYRTLTDEEKRQMTMIKDLGLELSIAIQQMELGPLSPHEYDGKLLTDPYLVVAHQRCEEAVMWAVKYITGDHK